MNLETIRCPEGYQVRDRATGTILVLLKQHYVAKAGRNMWVDFANSLCYFKPEDCATDLKQRNATDLKQRKNKKILDPDVLAGLQGKG